MKRILLLVLLLPTFNYAQEKQESTPETTVTEPKLTLSMNWNVSEPTQFGFSGEYKSKHQSDNRNSSYLLNFSAAGVNYSKDTIDVEGYGYVIELGYRTYVKKGKWNGFYAENYISYGYIKFDDIIGHLFLEETKHFIGRYSYLSIINPNVGYKFMIGKNFSFDPSIGANWKWEVKGKGDVDNKNINTFSLRGGFRIGYSF